MKAVYIFSKNKGVDVVLKSYKILKIVIEFCCFLGTPLHLNRANLIMYHLLVLNKY